ncbi:MAG: hypothetical protein EPO35_00965 [Acidobacteria bacterium]|nr:MAG: hypothetical protein EPO35_00965 [Acidobacteriota bacterium]
MIRRRDSEAGVSLIETLAATALILVAIAGLGSMGVVGTTTTENEGHLAARCTEYAQDKMEQLLVLAWGDTDADTRVFPAAAAGGTGLAVGGSSNTAAPVAGYVDYLDQNGNLLAAGAGVPADWFYIRAWQVTSPSANLKQVTVTATVRSTLGRTAPPTSTVAALKTFPFQP